MSASSSTKRRYNKLSPAHWAEIRSLWAIGNVTLGELSHRYSISTRAIQLHLKKNGVERGSEAATFAKEVREAVLKSELPDVDVAAARGRETKEITYANCEKIQNAIMRFVDEISDNPGNAFKAASAIKALSLAAAGVERLSATKLRVLGLDGSEVDREELPIIEIRELSPGELEAIKQEQKQSDWADDEDVVAEPRTSESLLDDHEASSCDVVVEIGEWS